MAEQLPEVVVTPDAPIDPWAAVSTMERPQGTTAGSKEPSTSADPYGTVSILERPVQKKPRDVGRLEALSTGVEHGLSFGTAPALHGLSAASEPTLKKFEETQGVPEGTASRSLPGHVKAALGAAELLANWMAGTDDPAAKQAYEKARQHHRETEEAALAQHPGYYVGGAIAGSTAIPGLGVVRPAAAGGRFVQGAVQGGAAGALYGSGSAIGEGKGPAEVAESGARGGVVGAAVGGPLGAAIGPRVVNPALPGARAAATAEDLGAALPRGVASDSPMVQATTGKLRQMPLAGERVTPALQETERAAGERIGGIAEQMAGGAPERAVADAAVRPALQRVIQDNNATIDAAYAGVRGQINADTTRFTMPRTDAALNRVMQARAAAGWANPAQGLEQFRNVAGGATFNGAQRARTDARAAGDVLNPQPGFNAADFNQITRAMTEDLRAMVVAGATNRTPQGRQAALDAFDAAEREFGRLADQNRLLNQLVNAQGEAAIGKLLGAAKENAGNVRLLAQLRQSMNPADFEQIGGVLLHELGHRASTGEFSLAQFATNWEKISDGAKRVLFDPQHVRNIDDIAAMGMHIKSAMRETSSSHSASALLYLEVLKDVSLLGLGIAHGDLGTAGAVAAASTAGAWLLSRWLSSPAGAASIGAWTRAYRALTLGQPTPARVAIFNTATRNLANTLGLKAQDILESAAARSGARAAPVDEGSGAPQQ